VPTPDAQLVHVPRALFTAVPGDYIRDAVQELYFKPELFPRVEAVGAASEASRKKDGGEEALAFLSRRAKRVAEGIMLV
jgi:hypothetical protein